MSEHPDLELLSAFIDAEPPEHAQIESHVATCRACSQKLDALRATVADLGALSDPVIDQKTSWAIRSAVLRERKPRKDVRKILVGLSSVAAVVALATGIISIQRGSNRPGTADSASAGLGNTGTFSVIASNTNFTDASLTETLAQFRKGSAAGTANNGSPQELPAGGTAGSLDRSALPLNQAALNGEARACFDSQIAAATKEPVRVTQVLAARYKGDPVFIFYLELPAGKPTRIELWGLSRSTCSVKIFKQTRF